MGKILVLIFIIFCLGVLYSLPLYIAVNLVLVVFNAPFHFTLLQSFAVSLLINTVYWLLFDDKEDK